MSIAGDGRRRLVEAIPQRNVTAVTFHWLRLWHLRLCVNLGELSGVVPILVVIHGTVVWNFGYLQHEVQGMNMTSSTQK
jgi:hypothetical protein